MASEPAHPRTRDAVLARVIEEANDQVDDDWTTADTLAFREYFGERLATRLAEAGLLADPAQTTELERLKARITRYQAELDKARSERAFALATSEAWKQERNDLERLMRRDQEQALRATVGRDLARADRDRLSLLLRGMARKLVAYRKWADGDVPTVHKLRAELAEVERHMQRDREQAVRATAGRGKALAERDERQTRIEAATAELKKWDALATRESEWMPCRAALAALAGDQPKAQKPLAWCSGCGLEVGTNRYLNRCGTCGEELQPRETGPKRGADYASVRVCGDEVYNHSYVDTAEGLSGEDLRNAEERDDAAEDVDHG